MHKNKSPLFLRTFFIENRHNLFQNCNFVVFIKQKIHDTLFGIQL